MSKDEQPSLGAPADTLAELAQVLLDATADVDGETVAEARNNLAAALYDGKNLYGRARYQIAKCVKTTNAAMHKHPYLAVGITVGAGALVGLLIARKCASKRNADS